MAIWWLVQTVAFSATAFACCIIISQSHRKKQQIDKADDRSLVLKIKVINNVSSPNVHNGKQVSATNLVNSNNIITPLTSRTEQISDFAKQRTSNAPIKPPRKGRKLFPTQPKIDEDSSNSIILNIRFLGHDDLNKTIQNKSISSCESGYGSTQSNSHYTPVIHINNSAKLANGKIQKDVLESTKLLMLNTLKKQQILNITISQSNDNRSANLITISQNDESQEINIMIPSFYRQCIVEHNDTSD